MINATNIACLSSLTSTTDKVSPKNFQREGFWYSKQTKVANFTASEFVGFLQNSLLLLIRTGVNVITW